MIKLYGITRSRASRCLWMLEELGQPYERVPVDYRSGQHKQPDYLAINPNGKLPALVDGDVALFESMAINLYLADAYGADKGLWPATAGDRGRCYQWSVWVMTEVEAHALNALRHKYLLPEDQRTPEGFQAACEALAKPLGILDAALADRPHLLGETFTVADLNVASVLTWARVARVPLDAVPHVADWLKRCLERPAQQAVLAATKAEAA